MKRNYEAPVFYAERYTFNASIAKCGINIDNTPPLIITKRETKLCMVQDEGHVYGGQNGKKGIIAQLGGANSITLFNDGPNSDGCQYDWDGRKNIVAQTGVSFAASFFGNEADQANHAPAYAGQSFLS